MNVVTRQDAVDASSNRYFTGEPCPKGHIEERRVKNRACLGCVRERHYTIRRVGGQRHEYHKLRSNEWKQSNSVAAFNYRLGNKLRIRILNAIAGGVGGSAVRDLGCSIAEFRDYIAAKFQPGMSWANHGEWHLDHIKPLASFDLTNKDHFLEACHFTNYQPLWALDNIAKGAKYVVS